MFPFFNDTEVKKNLIPNYKNKQYLQWKFLLIETTVHPGDLKKLSSLCFNMINFFCHNWLHFSSDFLLLSFTKITFLSIKSIASHTHVIQYHTFGYESYVTFINIKNMDMHIDIFCAVLWSHLSNKASTYNTTD